MNCEVFHLNELEVESFQIREVLRCILHTIAFHRALGVVRPKDVDSGLFDITYVQCGDVELEKKIEEKVDQFVNWVEKHPNRKSQICFSFYEERNKAAWFHGNKLERFYWEQWYISLNVTPPKAANRKSNHGKSTLTISGEERISHCANLEAALRGVLLQIIQLVNEKKDHIPPVLDANVIMSFPYEITIPSTSDSSFGMDMFKRMLQTGTPGMLS
eukprot:TRINITY_DN27508_c0_g1_i2.p1 TRINITY_DN27508_c0_g1~~TRINITY_DN27508_c0_g1_i2.p1  ORF type:complete len:216 (-),score=42.98 TRINITY_DN27508_c0_g1_i2:30-677(-)